MPRSRQTLASRLGIGSNKQPVALPFELWVMILMIVVDAYNKCYERCSSIDLPSFLIDWRKLLDYDYKSSGLTTNWKELRLVCHDWSIILDPKFRPYLQTNEASRFFDSKDIRSLVAFDFGRWYEGDCASYPSNQDLLYAARNITTLTIDNGISGTTMKAFIDLIFEHPQYFPLVRSFSYKTGYGLEPQFWECLEKTFPELTALRVGGPIESSGSLTLPKLQILELGIKSFPRFSFPSLRHLSLWGDPTDSEHQQLLRDHCHNLESLLLQSRLSSTEFFEGDFWMRFPKLMLLGSSNHTDLQGPPLGHPLNHLCLYDVRRDDWDSVLLAMDNFPKLRYLSLGGGFYPFQMSFLMNRCKHRGMVCSILPGQQQLWLVPKLTLAQRIERDIQIIAFILVVIPVVFVYFILGNPLI